MSEYAEAQQATADGLAALGLQVTLMVHSPSKIHAPEGILLTTYDQLQPQIAKQETTAYAFPSFGAAQTVMKSLEVMQQTVFLIYECHANTGPVEIAAKVFDTCHRHISAVKEIKQLTDPIKYQKYSTVLYSVKMDSSTNHSTMLEWQLPDLISDELLMPTRLAFENFGGKELRQGRYPGICETSSSPNGCYNSDKSKGSVPVTIKYNKTAGLAIIKIPEEIGLLIQQSDTSQDTQFQVKEGVDWNRMQRLKETADWTVMSTRHLNDQNRLSLAQELMSFRIKYYFLSKAQIIMKLSGIDIEVLRNLLHCSTTYLPFGQRQQSTQVSIGQITPLGGKFHRIVVNYSPIGSIPNIPLQIAKSSILPLIENEDDIVSTDLGYALISTFVAIKFEFHVVVNEDNANIPMLTFWIPHDIKRKFPSNFSVKDKEGTTISFTIEHCGNILPQTGAPGEPPRHETKGEHWRRVGEKSNPSFKNRLTVIAPASTQSAPQKRRFGLLKDAAVTFNRQQISYTYAEETFPWILFLERPPESEVLNTFLTHFGDTESVRGGQGDYCKQSFLQSESISKFTRILMFELPSGKKCQVNRIDGAEESLYLTKVDALQVYSFKASYLVILVPPFIDFKALLGLDNKAEALVAWKFQDYCHSNSVGSQSRRLQNAQCTPQSSQKYLTSNREIETNAKADTVAGLSQSSPKHVLRSGVEEVSSNTPFSQQVNPYQNSLLTQDHTRDAQLNGEQENLSADGTGSQKKEDEQQRPTPQEYPPKRSDCQGSLTVSPTAPWTQLPTSQPPRAKAKGPEHPRSNTAKRLDEKIDVPMIPPQSPHVSTPPKRIAQAHDHRRSSQKACLKELTTTRIDDDKDFDKAVTTALQSIDPILTPTSPQLDNDTHHADRNNSIKDDPSEHTPLNQPKVADNHLDWPAKENSPTYGPTRVRTSGVAVELTNDSHDKPPQQIKMPTSTNSVDKNSKGSPIQDALQRAATLSANDNTQICIDITEDDDNLHDDDAMKPTPGHETQTLVSTAIQLISTV